MTDPKPRFTLLTLLLLTATAPLWLVLAIQLPRSPGFGGAPGRIFITPFVLLGISAALARLMRPREHAWPIAIFVSPILVVTILYLATKLPSAG